MRRRILAYLDHRYGSPVAHDVDADPAAGALVALLRRSVTVGTDIDRMLATVCQADLTGARSIAQVLAARVRGTLDRIADDRLDPARLPHPGGGWVGPKGALERYHAAVADIVDRRTRTLGDIATAAPPAWAVDQWGHVPDDPIARATWTRAAGAVTAYRERWGVEAAPAELAAQAPPARDFARWQHWHDIRRWLTLDPGATARHRRGLDSQTAQTSPDRSRDTRTADLDAALTQLHAVRAILDQQPRGADPDVGPAPLPPEPAGPDIDL